MRHSGKLQELLVVLLDISLGGLAFLLPFLGVQISELEDLQWMTRVVVQYILLISIVLAKYKLSWFSKLRREWSPFSIGFIGPLCITAVAFGVTVYLPQSWCAQLVLDVPAVVLYTPIPTVLMVLNFGVFTGLSVALNRKSDEQNGPQ